MAADCPVCSGYWAARQVEINKAGDRHRQAMAEIRRKEAEGVPLERIQDVPVALQRSAAQTVL